MNKIIGIGVVALAVTFAGCESRGAARGGDAKNAVTANGCVQTEPGRDDHFVLANASLGSSASVAPSSANDPNAPASAASSTTGGVTYKLDGKERDLKQHVNQRVEIIGRLDSPSRDAKDNSTFAGEQAIDVDSVRMIAASCS
jgi:hypothetical protein